MEEHRGESDRPRARDRSIVYHPCMMTTPTRPRVICHMMVTIDGRIDAAGWPDLGAGRREYERVHATFDAEAWMCGRVTMEPFAGALRSEADVANEATPGAARDDFRAPGDWTSYAVALDPSGRLAWQTNDVDGDHVVAVLAERVSDDYLAFLRGRGVSYLLAGAREVDLALALRKLGATFGIRTVLLEGGGRINGSLLKAGLIDEVSLLVAPLADGATGTPALFDLDADAQHQVRRLALIAVERRADDVLWLRYRVG